MASKMYLVTPVVARHIVVIHLLLGLLFFFAKVNLLSFSVSAKQANSISLHSERARVFKFLLAIHGVQ